MKLTTLFWGATFLLLVFAPVLKAQEKTISKRNIPPPFFDSNRLRAIVRQAQIEREARRLEKEERFEEAIKKYLEAVELDRLLDGSDRGRPFASIIAVHQKQEKYEQALREVQYLQKAHPLHEPYIDWQRELEALIEALNTQSNRPVYNHIQYLKEKHKNDLPPQKYWAQTTWYTTTIIRLYDHIGDLDGGISFVDQILSYPKLNKKARAEYLRVRQAFEADKKAGTKGRATHALIQSDYFPW